MVSVIGRACEPQCGTAPPPAGLLSAEGGTRKGSPSPLKVWADSCRTLNLNLTTLHVPYLITSISPS